VFLAPGAGVAPSGHNIADLLERPRRKNHCNEATVPDDLDAAESGDIFQQATKVVLRVTCRYTLCHLSILAKTQQRK